VSEENDKRSVTTDALATLGTIIGAGEKRDAIHLAVEPVIAGEYLNPGDHITVRHGIAWRAARGKGLGIVDPFLEDGAREGQRFWFVMYPRQVRSLRHVWSHPAFPDEGATLPPRTVSKEASEKWLREFCDMHPDCPTYSDILIAVRGGTINDGYGPCHNDGEYLLISGQDAHGGIPDEFWDHIEAVTGLQNLPRAKYFTCSC
jgi:hypothetical protein